MRAGSRPFDFAFWLAVLAMVLNALWPLLAQARPAGGAGLKEICTSGGVKYVSGAASDGTASPPDQVSRHLQSHCLLCASGSDKPVAAAAPLEAGLAADLPGLSVAAFATVAPPGPLQRSPAHPRAPPDSL